MDIKRGKHFTMLYMNEHILGTQEFITDTLDNAKKVLIEKIPITRKFKEIHWEVNIGDWATQYTLKSKSGITIGYLWWEHHFV